MRPTCTLLLFALAIGCTCLAQSGNSGDTAKDVAGYQVHQSIEFGYRSTETTGNADLYNTFTNQHTGPRLLNQSLEMHSVGEAGVLFDDLTLTSFGWGGDPENVARLRMSKRHWYDFNASFRRDHNFFDYDLLANPLNPASANPLIPTIQVATSPHQFQVRRRMYDLDLTLRPDSRFSVRLGYFRNRSEGPSFSSFHEGTDVLLNQGWNVTSNQVRIGFDFRVMPKTILSYDQIVDFDKNDTDYSLASFATFALPNGVPVELGLPWGNGSPCAAPFTAPGVVNPGCNGYFTYLRNQRVRTTTPTEQLTLRHDNKRVNFVGRASYSASDLSSPYAEFFDGVVTRTRERQFTFSGPANTRRVFSSADLGVTFQVTSSLSVSDSFRFDNFRLPGSWNEADTSTAAAGNPATLLSPLGTVTSASSFIATFMGQKSYYNLLQASYSPGKHFGVRFGYKFRHRHLFKAEPEVFDLTTPEGSEFEGFEGDAIDVNEQGPVAGVWLRPSNHLRVNADVELMTSDNFFTRISPRQRQQYRFRATYRPRQWANVSASANLLETRNNQVDTLAREHYRNFGATASLFPRERFGVDLSYNFTDALQDAYICFAGTTLPAGAVANGCPTYDPTSAATIAANPNPNWLYSTYVNNTHYFNGLLVVRPAKRVTANLGYGITKVDGSTSILNPLQPIGPLQSTWHQPLGSLSIGLAESLSLNGYWNYDQYNEEGFVGPTARRYYHDNRTTVSVKYSF